MSSLVARADSMSYQFTLDRTAQVGPGSYELQITSFVLGSSTPHAVSSDFSSHLQYGDVDTLQSEFIDGALIQQYTELDVVTIGSPGGGGLPGKGIVLATGGAVYFSTAT